ncbi:hypothetical protein THRCLA_20771, partial [Thraustotheca clavata]
ACWRAWCDEKNQRTREEKRVEREKERQLQEEEAKKARLKEQNEASFIEWKRLKSQERKARYEAFLKDQEAHKELIEKVDEKRMANVNKHLDSIERIKKLTAKRRSNRNNTKKKSRKLPVYLHTNIPVDYITNEDELETRMHKQVLKLCKPSEIESHNTTMENQRYMAKLHSNNSQRADSLHQLRSWSTPSPEIYYLASVLYKLIALETPTNIKVIDIWRWLPWKVVRKVFQEDLVDTLQAITISDLDPRSLVLLYLHCAQPNFQTLAIKKRSVVGSALRSWVHNVAVVHELVDPTTQEIRSIDQLKMHSVSLHDIAQVYLLLHVFPYVNVRLKDRIKLTENQARICQDDIALLREVYSLSVYKVRAPVPVLPESPDDYSQLMSQIEFEQQPAIETPEVPQRSKLAARLAARLHEHKTLIELGCGKKSIAPSDNNYQNDCIVVYKLSLPKPEASTVLNPVNYMNEKRKDYVRRQSQQWNPTEARKSITMKPSRASSMSTSSPQKKHNDLSEGTLDAIDEKQSQELPQASYNTSTPELMTSRECFESEIQLPQQLHNSTPTMAWTQPDSLDEEDPYLTQITWLQRTLLR